MFPIRQRDAIIHNGQLESLTPSGRVSIGAELEGAFNSRRETSSNRQNVAFVYLSGRQCRTSNLYSGRPRRTGWRPATFAVLDLNKTTHMTCDQSNDCRSWPLVFGATPMRGVLPERRHRARQRKDLQ